jgi:hypothetical protein
LTVDAEFLIFGVECCLKLGLVREPNVVGLTVEVDQVLELGSESWPIILEGFGSFEETDEGLKLLFREVEHVVWGWGINFLWQILLL